MKIEYIRNAQSGYMRIEMDISLSRTEEEMLERNQMEGFLPVRWQKENGKYLMRYDITGKQALDAVLENTLADENILKTLLVGICVAVRQLEKYLLWQEGLLLLPEAIFWDTRLQTMYFCYYPDQKETLQVRLARLLEYVLVKTDHKNIQAVQLAYGVYETVQNQSFCIKDMQTYLMEEASSRKEPEWQEDGAKAEKFEDMQEEEEIWQEEKEVNGQGHWKIGIMEKVMSWIKKRLKRESREKKQERVVDYEVEESIEDWTETRILNVSEEITGILKYEGANLLQDIVVSKVPFVIGSAGDCDGVINSPTISRYHARITKREDVYFIEDLNSTNGTKTNGGLLSYKTRVSLKKNESIYFANEPYRFM